MCWLGWKGEVVVLPSWKSVSFPWQLGNGAGGPGLETLLYDSGFRWAAVSWFLRNPVFVAGYSQPHPHPTPPHRLQALARRPQLFCRARDCKLAETISRANRDILQVEELGFFPLCCRLFSFKASAATL